jgi:uncharacterized protein (TIGR03000 family)
MMAMTSGTDAVSFGRHRCNGCEGGSYASCSGGGCHGGYGCHGGGRRRGHRCHGGGYCNGGGYCSGGWGGSGCSGGYYGGYGCSGSYGGSGCSGGYGSPYMGAPSYDRGAPGGPGRRPETVPAPKPGTPPKGTEEETSLPAPATIRVSLPANARLMVDGVPTSSMSATRLFVSPERPRDKTFFYTLTGEINRDGQTVSTSKQVQVRAGEESNVSFDFPATTVASK